MRRKPISKPFTFEVERYVGVDILDPLQPGTELVLPIVLMVWRRAMYKNFTPFRIYTFTGCVVMEKKYGELNAEKSGLLEETTTIGYREMMRMTMPAGVFDDFGDDFDITQTLTPTDGKPKTESYKHRKAFHPDNDSDRAAQRLWMGFDLQKQKALQAAVEAAEKSGDTKLVEELKKDPLFSATFTSTPSAITDNKSTKATQRLWDGFNPNAKPASDYSATNPAPEGTVLSTSSAHPDERSSMATQRLWNGLNPDAKSPSDFDENNPAPADTVFTVSSAHPDERSSEATGTLYDIKTGKTTRAVPDEKSTKATGTEYNFKEKSGNSARPDEKSTKSTGTTYNVKDGSGKSARPDEKSSPATQVLWPGATAQDKPPKTLRANVLRTLNS